MSERRSAKLVTFGRGGDTVHLGGHCTCSGYGKPDNPHAAAPHDGPDGYDFPDGCPVIDSTVVEFSKAATVSIGGPMVDVDLAPGEVDAMGDLSNSIVAQAVMADPGNQFGTIAKVHQSTVAAKKKYGSLDYVDVQTYIGLWREVGARIGAYQNGKIVWEGKS